MVGCLQLMVSFLCEVISIQIILSTTTYIDAVKDFIALLIINDLDNLFFANLQQEDLHVLISNGSFSFDSLSLALTNLLKIWTTSNQKHNRGENIQPRQLQPIFDLFERGGDQGMANISSSMNEEI